MRQHDGCRCPGISNHHTDSKLTTWYHHDIQIILHTKHIALRALNKQFSLDVERLTNRWFLCYRRFIVLTLITPYGRHCCGSPHECQPHGQVDRSKWERRVYSQLGPPFRTVCLKGNEMRRAVLWYPYRWYPAKRALPAMLTAWQIGPFWQDTLDILHA